uniref:Uncharacterized protein n=1 Tax=Arundo donax TaxID=35708 RepID=A0A0A9FV65_ARUDO
MNYNMSNVFCQFFEQIYMFEFACLNSPLVVSLTMAL